MTRLPHPSRHRRISPCSDGGFTLLEVLVALVLTALLSAGLATAVQTARRVLAATERIATTSDTLAAQGFLRASMASAFRVPVNTTLNPDDLTFAGSATRLTFATGYVPKGLQQGLYRLDLELRPSLTGRGLWDLVASERPSRAPPASPAGAMPSVAHSSTVIRGVSAIRFSYFGKLERDAEAEAWLEQWTAKDWTPRIVRLEVTFPSGDLRSWPVLLMPLEQTAP